MMEAPRRLETREMLIKSQSQILQEFGSVKCFV